MEKVLTGANLERAWNNVRRNGGVPGPDGVTIAESPDYCGQHWPRIRKQLLEGTLSAEQGLPSLLTIWQSLTAKKQTA